VRIELFRELSSRIEDVETVEEYEELRRLIVAYPLDGRRRTLERVLGRFVIENGIVEREVDVDTVEDSR
jgi:hypothetical protein